MNAFIGHFETESMPVAKVGFVIDKHDRLTVEGVAFRLNRYVGRDVELIPENDKLSSTQYPMATLSRLSGMGLVKHEVGYYLPPDLKHRASIVVDHVRPSDLPEAQKKRYFSRYAQVMAVEELMRAGLIRNNDNDIEAHRAEIAKLSAPYFEQAATEHNRINHQLEHQKDDGFINRNIRARKGGKTKVAVELFASATIRKLVAKYQKYGPTSLVDSLAKSGNRTNQFLPEEQALMMELIHGSYLTVERKSKKHTVQDVQRGFGAENQAREAQGLTPFRVPGRNAVHRAIGKIDRLTVLIARWGYQTAIKKLGPVGKGLEVSRPGERVEVDEWCIDLISIIYSAGLHKALGSEFMEALDLDNEKARWWLVVAIDCRTKIVLGMKLTRNPNTEAARECMRMVMSDKGRWADEVGALTPWSHAVVPEQIVSDNGPAFKSELFTSTCLDLGMSVLRTIGGIPGMRGTVERMFLTAGLDLMPRLRGRTFSNPQERGDYPAEKRACLDADDVAFALVRWIVDIYHNTPHAGLLGLTPLQQWESDMESGNYPLRALPDTRSKRLAFGKRLTRSVERTGITIMGIRYHSQDLAVWFLQPGPKRVDVRWDAEDLGAIEIFLEGGWREVPAVHGRYVGVNFHVWSQARRALRARSANRRVWDEETVFRAIDEIEALAAQKSALYGILDTAVSDEYFKKIEGSLFASFRTSADEKLSSDGTEIGQEIMPRAPDVDLPPRRQKKPKIPKTVTVAPDVLQSEAPLSGKSSTAAKAPQEQSAATTPWAPVKLEKN